MPFKVLVKSKKSKARVGKIKTAHGEIETPFFMPIATRAAVKGLTPADLKSIGAQIVLANTYHLWLRPGERTVKKIGGLHRFMQWSGPILTDSGGYQVFSLAKIRKTHSSGVEFQSHLNGEKRFLTPEKAIAIQRDLGSDIMMVLDVCSPYPCSKDEAEKDLERTIEWARKCKIKNSKRKIKRMLFGIVQGAVYRNLRLKSAQALVRIGFDGYAIGGLAVGEPVKKMYEVLNYTVPELPEDRPRYLMGVGYPEQMAEVVRRGVDMFDCVLPARNARHGTLFVSRLPWLSTKATTKTRRWNFGKTNYTLLHIRQERYREDFSLLDENCDCPTCQAEFSRAYLRHLLMTGDPLYVRLATLHNLRFYLRWMDVLRAEIRQGRL